MNEFEGCSDGDSAGSFDPHRSSSLPKCQSQQKESYETDLDSGNEGSHAKPFERHGSGKLYPHDVNYLPYASI